MDRLPESRSWLKMGEFHQWAGPRRKTGLAWTGERGILSVSRRAERGKTDHPRGVTRKRMLSFDLEKITIIPRMLGRMVRSYRFALAAFLIPLGIRAIPELLAGPYPIGYDTIASYVPIMYYWASGNLGPFNPAIGGWFLFAVLGLTYQLTRLDPVIIAKATGPALYGALGLALYYFSRVSLGWTQRKSLFLVMIGSTYFITLRVGWDLFRNTLAISFLLLALSLGPDIASNRKSVGFAILGWLTVATHLLVGAVFLGVVGLDALRRENVITRRYVLLAIPAAFQFMLSLALLQFQGISLVQLDTTPQLLTSVIYPLYVFLPMSFLIALGLRGFRGRGLLDWIIICVLGIVLTITPLSTSSYLVGSDRWTWMMSIPLSVVAVEGYTRLPQRIKKPMARNIVQYSWAIMMILLTASYLFAPASMALPYYDHFAPSSMLQNTIPVEESPQLVMTMHWLSSNIPKNGILMLHNAIYGWAKEYFRAPNTIVWFYPGTTLSAGLSYALDQGYSMIYTVWWADGQGWYGEPTVPNGFVVLHREGAFGVFLFLESGSSNN